MRTGWFRVATPLIPLSLLVAPLLAGCSHDNGASPTASARSAESSAGASSGGSSASSVSPAVDGRPQESLVSQGGQYWGVYLADSQAADDARVTAAYDRLQGLGYKGSVGQVCDAGSLDSLGIGEGDTVAAVYFQSRDEALQFVTLWQAPYVGYGQVRTFCAD